MEYNRSLNKGVKILKEICHKRNKDRNSLISNLNFKFKQIEGKYANCRDGSKCLIGAALLKGRDSLMNSFYATD